MNMNIALIFSLTSNSLNETKPFFHEILDLSFIEQDPFALKNHPSS